jgi:hypothetical protein
MRVGAGSIQRKGAKGRILTRFRVRRCDYQHQRGIMNAVSQLVREFFAKYERSRNTLDPGLIESQYPASFMLAGPDGVRVADKRAVLAGLAKGQELFKAVG